VPKIRLVSSVVVLVAAVMVGALLGAVGQGQPKYGGVYTVATQADLVYFTPFHPNRTADQVAMYNVFEGLYELNGQYKPAPILAINYEVSEDGLTWIFHLRKGVLFHNGEQFTAKDVKYTYEWAMNSDNGAETHSSLKLIASIECLDPYTVKFTTKDTYVSFLSVIAVHRIVPSYYHQSVTPEEFNRHPIGTGPYKFAESVPGDHVTLTAFENYWGGCPYIDTMRIVPIPEASSRAIALANGSLDGIAWPLNPEDTKRLADDDKLQGYSGTSLSVNHYLMNHLNPFFQDKKVRQAMMYALNRKATVESLMKGLAIEATSYVSPSLPSYNPNVKTYPYDPGKARELLGEAGWEMGPDGVLVNKDGEKFEITCELLMGDQLRSSQAQMDVEYFRAVGIDLKLRYNEMAMWVHKMISGAEGEWNYDLSLQNWTFTEQVDPDCRRYFTRGAVSNWTNWSDPEMEELAEEGVRELDSDERQSIYNRMQAIFAEEVPFLYIQYWTSDYLISKDIKGLTAQSEVKWSFYPIYQIKDYWIDREQ